jgi:hypothetical protein
MRLIGCDDRVSRSYELEANRVLMLLKQDVMRNLQKKVQVPLTHWLAPVMQLYLKTLQYATFSKMKSDNLKALQKGLKETVSRDFRPPVFFS